MRLAASGALRDLSSLPRVAAPQRVLEQAWARAAVVAMLLALSALAFYCGVIYRRAEWFRTEQVRFRSDVFNGFRWGRAAMNYGLVNVYDLDWDRRIPGVQRLDYTPLRLTVVWLWARWAAQRFPQITTWENNYELTRFMLRFNLAAELMCSVLTFLLIRMWIIRADDARRDLTEPPRPFRGVGRGMLGALLFWFNPAVIRSAQTYPQWDVWNMPFFLGAVFLACADWWFAAGACFVVGAMLKGQILLVTPIFLFWPILSGRAGAALRFGCGFVMAWGFIVLPWLLASPAAMIWFMLMMIACAMTLPITLRWKIDWRIAVGAIVAAVLLAWPWASNASLAARALPLAVLAAIAVSRLLPGALIAPLYGAASGVSIMLMMPLFNASRHWFDLGFEFGSSKIMQTAIPGTFNLPSILMESFGWPNDPQIMLHVPMLSSPVMFRHLMLGIYVVALILCAIGAVLHSRRSDPRFLVAITAPWLAFFVILTQMNNRYLMWPAGFASLMIGVDLGMTLLGGALIAICYTAIAGGMNIHLASGTPQHIRMFQSVTPHLAWAVMLILAINLYVAVTPRRGSQTA
jgi:hypothetical protein